MYTIKGAKDAIALGGDATSMAYCACLHREFNISEVNEKGEKQKIELSDEMIAEVFMNTLIVNLF